MSWYLANQHEVLDQLASGGGLTELVKASADYPALATFFSEGSTKNIDVCILQLEKLASRTEDADVKDTASGLATLMHGQMFVAITQGFGFAPEHDSEKGEPESENEDAEPVGAKESAATARPKIQAQRDKSLKSAIGKIMKLMRARFRAQRIAVLSGSNLRRIHAALDRATGGAGPLPRRAESGSPRGAQNRSSVPDGNRSRILRESNRQTESGSPDCQSASDTGSDGKSVRRVTGSVDAPLTDAGREQARDLKARVGSMAVFTAPNTRARETGRIISTNSQDAEWLRPWGLGAFEGMSLDAARKKVNLLITDHPDVSPGISRYSGKEGDTFNEVSSRLVGGVLARQKELKPGERILNVTSGRAIHIVHAAAVKGFHSVDKDELICDSEFSKPGDLFWLTPENGLTKIYEPVPDGQYFAQHGETDWNEGVAASEALREADDRPERSAIVTQIENSLGAQIYNQPVTAADAKVFDGSISAAIDAGAAAAGSVLGIDAPQVTESFISEYLKDAGFSRLTGELDKTTVDRLASTIADAYEEGLDFDGVVSAVKSEFADFSATRAKMIAQTELNDAWNQSVFHFGKEAGATQKSWETDLAPCPICITNALGGAIDIDEDFESGDDAPPAHPSCYCSLMVHA